MYKNASRFMQRQHYSARLESAFWTEDRFHLAGITIGKEGVNGTRTPVRRPDLADTALSLAFRRAGLADSNN